MVHVPVVENMPNVSNELDQSTEEDRRVKRIVPEVGDCLLVHFDTPSAGEPLRPVDGRGGVRGAGGKGGEGASGLHDVTFDR
jgi:hypothetical protein